MTTTLQPPSELLQRHHTLFNGTQLLIGGQLLDDYPLELAQLAQSSTICTTHAGQAAHYQSRDIDNCQVTLSAVPELTQRYNCLILYIPKAKQEADYWLNLFLPKLHANAQIFIVGENRGGINAACKLLNQYQIDGRKIDAARRCSLIYGERGEQPIEFDAANWYQQFNVHLPQGDLCVCSMPGVFNHGKLDAGTQLLLETLPALQGRGLDFGCGAGIIGAAIALQTGAQINAIDVSAQAALSTKRTFAANQLQGHVDCFDGIRSINGPFDFIVSNPPFHLGVQTQYDTSREFIRQASSKLTANGQLWLVANSFLPYKELLEAQFSHCQVVTDNRKFRVYCCHN
ncbi:16S rRNA (guanine(1207)-N(2))-methyltransferase RsmC [Celerinatantimonas yamalensis]|uniref:Ribosomal RNA small subunit methyltransferase C n=1 Tax=Celerinatantimonas yamalensis TaxID=559956 RepID=A0ABW9G4M1_9GAMM